MQHADWMENNQKATVPQGRPLRCWAPFKKEANVTISVRREVLENVHHAGLGGLKGEGFVEGVVPGGFGVGNVHHADPGGVMLSGVIGDEGNVHYDGLRGLQDEGLAQVVAPGGMGDEAKEHHAWGCCLSSRCAALPRSADGAQREVSNDQDLPQDSSMSANANRSLSFSGRWNRYWPKCIRQKSSGVLQQHRVAGVPHRRLVIESGRLCREVVFCLVSNCFESNYSSVPPQCWRHTVPNAA